MKSNLRFYNIALLFFLSYIFSLTTFGQTAPLQFYIQPFQFESGIYNGDGNVGSEYQEIFVGTIELHPVPWLQLHFSETNLSNNSYLIIESLYDGYWQKLNIVSMSQWNNYSAYFNGSAVQLKLFIAPEDNDVFFTVDEIIVGEWEAGDPIFSICGPTDDRELSNQPATGRLISPGCTGWIIPNGKIVSAGHCLTSASTSSVLQFNVPLSLPNGTLQHPPPEHQYALNVSTNVFVNGGVGNDWGVIEAYPNSNTNLLPIQAQGSYWNLAQDLGPDSIRITGCGTTSPANERNRVQQTHLGPNANSSGTTLRYRTDTTGGNSGSPVIDEATGLAIGVHSHGGCTSTGGNNNGTSFFNTAFWNAVEQGIPVELVSFNASMVDGNVELSWLTITETNNSGFEIERATSSTTPVQEWVNVGFVPGFGTTTEPKSYSYLDSKLGSGKYSYRLKQIDFDGTFTYSNIVEIEMTVRNSFVLEQNYPNPFNPSTKIVYSIPSNQFVSLKVFDVLGKEVATIVNELLQAGKYEVEFSANGGSASGGNASSLPSGIYFYEVRSGNLIQTKKMVLLR